MAPQARSRRRWLQFSIRGLFVTITLLAIWLALIRSPDGRRVYLLDVKLMKADEVASVLATLMGRGSGLGDEPPDADETYRFVVDADERANLLYVRATESEMEIVQEVLVALGEPPTDPHRLPWWRQRVGR